jgi:hypothetical protein
MSDNCPHCGARLPQMQDAYCPHCHEELDAAPAPVRRHSRPNRSSSAAHRGTGSDRPLGISILAVLHIVGGIILGVMQLVLLGKLNEIEAPLRSIGIPPVLLVIGVGFLALLGTAAGVGMWTGKKWGWWLGAFYYVYSITRNATALVTVAELANEIASDGRGPGYYYVKHTGRIAVSLLILLYFFKENVLHFFGLEDISKSKAISLMIGICVAISGLATAYAWLAS